MFAFGRGKFPSCVFLLLSFHHHPRCSRRVTTEAPEQRSAQRPLSSVLTASTGTPDMLQVFGQASCGGVPPPLLRDCPSLFPQCPQTRVSLSHTSFVQQPPWRSQRGPGQVLMGLRRGRLRLLILAVLAIGHNFVGIVYRNRGRLRGRWARIRDGPVLRSQICMFHLFLHESGLAFTKFFLDGKSTALFSLANC